jgi:hypothetical protein
MPYSPEDDKYVIAKEDPSNLMARSYWTGHGWSRDISKADKMGTLAVRMRLAELRRGSNAKLYGVSVRRWEAHVREWKAWYAAFVAEGLTHAEASLRATQDCNPASYKLDGGF